MLTKPNVLTRFKAAYQFYRQGFPRKQSNNSRIPFIWPAWRHQLPQWQLIDYQSYADEGFSANAIIYAAIMYKARAGIIAPLRAYRGTEEEPELLPPAHWLQQLCKRPNPFQSWPEFMSLNLVYFNLAGNSYTALAREGNRIKHMYLFRPDRVWIIPSPDKKRVIGFYYVPEGHSWGNGIPWLAEDVVHIKLPNPNDPLDGMGYGLSSLSPAARSGDVDNSLTKFLQLFFRNGAMPQGMFTWDVPMIQEDMDAARNRIMEIYGGFENWSEPLVMDQGGKYTRMGFTFDEMDVSALDARNESRLASVFGVPLTLIESRPGIVQSTYSNKQTDREMFWEDTMEPELGLFEADYQHYLTSDSDEFVMFDYSKTPGYQKKKLARLAELREGLKVGAVKKNEYRAELGLDPDPEMDKPEPEPVGDVVTQAEEVVQQMNGNGGVRE